MCLSVSFLRHPTVKLGLGFGLGELFTAFPSSFLSGSHKIHTNKEKGKGKRRKRREEKQKLQVSVSVPVVCYTEREREREGQMIRWRRWRSRRRNRDVRVGRCGSHKLRGTSARFSDFLLFHTYVFPPLTMIEISKLARSMSMPEAPTTSSSHFTGSRP